MMFGLSPRSFSVLAVALPSDGELSDITFLAHSTLWCISTADIGKHSQQFSPPVVVDVDGM